MNENNIISESVENKSVENTGSKNKFLNDKLGREITKGCYVLYVTMTDGDGILSFGKIVDIKKRKKDERNYQRYRYDFILISIKSYEHWVTKEIVYRLRPPREYCYNDKIVVVDFRLMPEYARNILSDVEIVGSVEGS